MAVRVEMARKERREAKISIGEARKRAVVLVKPRRIVLVKLYALHNVKVSELGIPRCDRDEEALDALHAKEAEIRGLLFAAYRAKGDTGYCLIQKGEYRGIRIGNLIDQFEAIGLHYVESHWSDIEGKGATIFVNFATDEFPPSPIPEKVHELLLRRFNDVMVWCNFKFNDIDDPSKGQFRLDTINLAFPHIHEGQSWEMYIPSEHPNTYRMR